MYCLLVLFFMYKDRLGTYLGTYSPFGSSFWPGSCFKSFVFSHGIKQHPFAFTVFDSLFLSIPREVALGRAADQLRL